MVIQLLEDEVVIEAKELQVVLDLDQLLLPLVDNLEVSVHSK